MLAEAGCTVTGETVSIPPAVVEEAIASAPKRIAIYNRDGDPVLDLGSETVYFNSGYTSLEFFDLDTGERREYTLDDCCVASRLADALPNIDIVGHPGSVRPTEENPLEVINHLEFEAMLTNTGKPLHVLVADAEILNDCYDMAEAVTRTNGAELRDRPFVMPYVNPISPLAYNEEVTDKLIVTADRGVPVICGPMPLAGGTAPVTMAGTIAQGTAETLAGLVITQTRQKGVPFIMSTAAYAPLDMGTGNIALGPEGLLMQLGSVEMGHYLGLPVRGGYAWTGQRGTIDGDSGRYQMMGALAAMLAGRNAGVLAGTGPALESCVAADELIGMLKTIVSGVHVDDETLALDVIRDVGPGAGTYLGHEHTFRHFRDFWQPGLMPYVSHETWEAQGSRTMDDRVRERTREIVVTHRPKPIPESARNAIAGIIGQARERAAAKRD